jgi:hypothetical protein
MAKNDALFSAPFGTIYRLSKPIAAIQSSRASDGHAELGTISHLPEGAELTFCGDGFNDSTLKVRWGGQLYFVFMQDFAPAEPTASELENTTPRKPVQTQRFKQFAASQLA